MSSPCLHPLHFSWFGTWWVAAGFFDSARHLQILMELCHEPWSAVRHDAIACAGPLAIAAVPPPTSTVLFLLRSSRSFPASCELLAPPRAPHEGLRSDPACYPKCSTGLLVTWQMRPLLRPRLAAVLLCFVLQFECSCAVHQYLGPCHNQDCGSAFGPSARTCSRCGKLISPPRCIGCAKDRTLSINRLEDGSSVEEWQAPDETTGRVAVTRTRTGHRSAECSENSVLAIV